MALGLFCRFAHVCGGEGRPKVARNAAFRESWIPGRFGHCALGSHE
jgi:hypothetical protein